MLCEENSAICVLQASHRLTRQLRPPRLRLVPSRELLRLKALRSAAASAAVSRRAGRSSSPLGAFLRASVFRGRTTLAKCTIIANCGISCSQSIDASQIDDYIFVCTEHGAPKVDGSPERQSLRRRSLGIAGRRRHRLGALLFSPPRVGTRPPDGESPEAAVHLSHTARGHTMRSAVRRTRKVPNLAG